MKLLVARDSGMGPHWETGIGGAEGEGEGESEGEDEGGGKTRGVPRWYLVPTVTWCNYLSELRVRRPREDF